MLFKSLYVNERNKFSFDDNCNFRMMGLGMRQMALLYNRVKSLCLLRHLKERSAKCLGNVQSTDSILDPAFNFYLMCLIDSPSSKTIIPCLRCKTLSQCSISLINGLKHAIIIYVDNMPLVIEISYLSSSSTTGQKTIPILYQQAIPTS